MPNTSKKCSIFEEKSALRMLNQFNSIQYNRGIEKFEKNTVCKQVLALV